MIEEYSFLREEELAQQRGGIKKSLWIVRGEKWGVLREFEAESQRGEELEDWDDTNGACGRKNTVKVSFNYPEGSYI